MDLNLSTFRRVFQIHIPVIPHDISCRVRCYRGSIFRQHGIRRPASSYASCIWCATACASCHGRTTRPSLAT
ncbi:heat-stable enterotoxin EAST1 [Escherichia coli]|uniref:heat-stable enterotoxin EAST1 n=1 Tax=Escherichia coli TaxID=562 RepID=UPI003976C3A2